MEFNRCYGCMRKLEVPGAVCPHCGYDNTNDPLDSKKQPSHLLPCGTILDGQYVVGRSLGQGGFGITYIGFDLNLELPVCIKEYYPEGAAMRSAGQSHAVCWGNSENAQYMKQSRKSFVKEAQKAAKLRDLEHVVTVWGVFFENDTSYIVMDYIEGETLKHRMVRTQKRLSEEECITLLTPVMQDLGKAHERGIIHRDIKPDNIMLRLNGEPVLLDMGAAKDMEKTAQNSALSSDMVVSHGFSPMEQYRQHGDIGPWTDVYAMCATMYYCVTGKVPPPSIDRVAGEKVDFTQFSPTFSAALERGLVIKSEERLQSMEALLSALSGKIPKKSKLPLILGAAALVVLLFFGGKALLGRKSPVETQAPSGQSIITESPTTALPITTDPALDPSVKQTPAPLLPGTPSSASAEEFEEVFEAGLRFSVYADYAVVTGREEETREAVIPSAVQGLPVTEIASGAFAEDTALKSVVIPASVTKIGTMAFSGKGTENAALTSIAVAEDNPNYCARGGVLYSHDMKELIAYPAGLAGSCEIPDTVARIGPYAFYGCRRVSSITIPESVTSIEESAFSYCTEITYIEIPKTVENIGDRAFSYCSLLRYITVPEGVKNIGKSAFVGCTVIKAFTVPASVVSIGDSTFLSCPSLEEIQVKDDNASFCSIGGALYSKDTTELIAYPTGRTTANIVIPDGVQRIRANAFLNCEALKYITLADSVSYIGSFAFSGCTELRHIVIPEGVSSLEESTFAGCENLQDATLPQSLTLIGKNAFSGCKTLFEFVVPEGVMMIEDGAFQGCRNLLRISLPNTLIDIGNNVFADCAALTKLTIPESVKTIGQGVLDGTAAKMELHAKEGSYAASFFAEDARLALD